MSVAKVFLVRNEMNLLLFYDTQKRATRTLQRIKQARRKFLKSGYAMSHDITTLGPPLVNNERH